MGPIGMSGPYCIGSCRGEYSTIVFQDSHNANRQSGPKTKPLCEFYYVHFMSTLCALNLMSPCDSKAIACWDIGVQIASIPFSHTATTKYNITTRLVLWTWTHRQRQRQRQVDDSDRFFDWISIRNWNKNVKRKCAVQLNYGYRTNLAVSVWTKPKKAPNRVVLARAIR